MSQRLLLPAVKSSPWGSLATAELVLMTATCETSGLYGARMASTTSRRLIMRLNENDKERSEVESGI
jgi:hypothetical protein